MNFLDSDAMSLSCRTAVVSSHIAAKPSTSPLNDFYGAKVLVNIINLLVKTQDLRPLIRGSKITF